MPRRVNSLGDLEEADEFMWSGTMYVVLEVNRRSGYFTFTKATAADKDLDGPEDYEERKLFEGELAKLTIDKLEN